MVLQILWQIAVVRMEHKGYEDPEEFPVPEEKVYVSG